MNVAKNDASNCKYVGMILLAANIGLIWIPNQDVKGKLPQLTGASETTH
jgi:hypothetical protein